MTSEYAVGKALLEKVITGHRNERVYLCERDFALFAMYYFAEYFVYSVPDFQWKMYKLLNEFTAGRFSFILWIMFRESAKTSIAKMYAVYCIAYSKKRFINYDSYDKGNAEAALFDIATWLQTNKRLIADFGQLYFEDQRTAAMAAKIKRLNEFVTANRVKVKAYSTQESTRGRIFGRFRPDLYIVDDFETEITAKSAPVTAKVIAHLDTLKTGLSVDGQIIFLCNLITETGSVASLIGEAKENPAAWRYMRVDVEKGGEIAWPDKYVATNEEAAKINAHIENRKEHKVSLEQKRKDLNAGGRKVYEAEMLNNPEASGDIFFNRGRVDLDIIRAKKNPPVKEVGGLSIWEEFKSRNVTVTIGTDKPQMPRYAFGGDTSKGVGRDACTSVGIRFSQLDTEPSVVVATYQSNTIAPDEFGDEMATHGRLYGECMLAPELNNTGFATVTRLKAIYPVHRIYRRVEEDQVGKTITKDLGWEARPGAVEAIYFNFRAAYDAGQVKVFCPILLAEIRAFTRRELESASKRGEIVTGAGVMTKHFDMLRAACIAWEMRSHAMPSTGAKKYKQPGYDPHASGYQG